MDQNLRHSLDSELRLGERVLWAGQPQGSLLTTADATVIPFSLVFLGFVAFGIQHSLSADTWPFPLFLLPFLAVGLYLSIGRFVVKAMGRRKTVYAVTNERAIEKVGNTVRSVRLAQLPPLQVTAGRTRGTIVFGSTNDGSSRYPNTGLDRFGQRGGVVPMSFFDIPDAAYVGRVIEDAAAAAT